MSTYRVVCTEQTNCSQSGHIVGVGTGVNADKANASWTVQEVWTAIGQGDRFYTEVDGFEADVQIYRCPCGHGSLKSDPDATTANNLDSLRLCRWKAA